MVMVISKEVKHINMYVYMDIYTYIYEMVISKELEHINIYVYIAMYIYIYM
jgi:hypothetical protein